MNNQGQIKIGREFFAKIKNDYSDWKWALVREFLQNCFDAPRCDEVEVHVSRTIEGHTKLVVLNNGLPMTEDVLFNKLLTLGGSGKNFEGEHTGGFGVAKSLLYYTHRSYVIHTGTIIIEGEGAQFARREATYLNGTKSTIVMDGDLVTAIKDMCCKFASMSQWKGTLTLNGEHLVTDLKKGARRKDLGFGVVYTNNSFSNVCIVRLNGQPMFTRYTRYKGCVLVELTGKANETLTSNRDSLRGDYNSELSDLLTALAVDKRSALREQKANYKRYLGEKLKNEAKQPKAAKNATISDMVDFATILQAMVDGTGVKTEQTPSTVSGGGIQLRIASAEDVQNITIGQEFIIKNTTGMETPAYYTPGDEFSSYSKSLVRVWTAIMLKIYQIHEVSDTFSVGFVLDEESEAEYEKTSLYGKVYYINPAKVVCQKKNTQCRSFKARYTGSWSDRFALISVAAHEFVHGAFGLMEHDEDYAGKLTDVMAKVMMHLKEFTVLCRA